MHEYLTSAISYELQNLVLNLIFIPLHIVHYIISLHYPIFTLNIIIVGGAVHHKHILPPSKLVNFVSNSCETSIRVVKVHR